MKLLKEIPACFWAESKAGYLDTHEKLLLIYLISHSGTNRLGCFRLPLHHMAYDLEWSKEYTTACFNKLIRFNFLIWDPTTEWSYLTDFLDWFPIKNNYQGKYIEHVFEEIPEKAIIFKIVVGHLLQISYLDKIFRQRLISCWKKTLEKEVDTDDPTQEKNIVRKQKVATHCCQCGGNSNA